MLNSHLNTPFYENFLLFLFQTRITAYRDAGEIEHVRNYFKERATRF